MVIKVFYFVDTEKWLNVKPKLQKCNPLETTKNPVVIYFPSFWCTSRQGEKSVSHDMNHETIVSCVKKIK